jgi:hypothetical protein
LPIVSALQRHLTYLRWAIEDGALQRVGERFAPALQIGLARIQPPTMLGLGPHAEVHMRVGVVVVQHHHELVVRQLGLRELARRLLHGQLSGSARHRQRDVESLATLAGLCDVVDRGAA